VLRGLRELMVHKGIKVRKVQRELRAHKETLEQLGLLALTTKEYGIV